MTALKHPGSDNHMRGAVGEVAGGIVQIDAAADMQAAGIGIQGSPRGWLIAGTEHDYVSPLQTIAPVEFCVVGAGPVRYKVCAQGGGPAVQRAADNLLHFAIMQIDTRTKHGFKVIALLI